MIALGSPRHWCASVTSTMDELTRLASAGAPEGTVVVAGEQTAGRGRAGRAWHAPAGTGLLMSVLLRPSVSPEYFSTLPLMAGVAIAEGIEVATDGALDRTIELKWPNDLFVNDRKLGGLLMHSRSTASSAVSISLGIGINVGSLSDDLPDSATSLAVETGRLWSLDEVERSVLDRLSVRYDEWLRLGAEAVLDEWRRRARFIGQFVAVLEGDQTITGTFTDISCAGGLLIETETGVQEIVAGDLVRGPRMID